MGTKERRQSTEWSGQGSRLVDATRCAYCSAQTAHSEARYGSLDHPEVFCCEDHRELWERGLRMDVEGKGAVSASAKRAARRINLEELELLDDGDSRGERSPGDQPVANLIQVARETLCSIAEVTGEPDWFSACDALRKAATSLREALRAVGAL